MEALATNRCAAAPASTPTPTPTGRSGPLLLLVTRDAEWPRRLQAELAYGRRREALRQVSDLAQLDSWLALAGERLVLLVDLACVGRELGALALRLGAGGPVPWQPGRDGLAPVTWLALARRDDGAGVLAALRLGAAGAMPIDAKPSEWLAALDAAQRGELPVHPVLARQVFLPLLGVAGGGASAPRATDRHGAPAAALSAREVRVLALASEGLDYLHMAQELTLSRHTVITYARRAMRKLGARSLPQAIGRAASAGLLPVAGCRPMC